MHPDLDNLRPLLMGLIDGELTPEEAAQVNEALIRSQPLREEYEKLLESSQALESLSMLEPADHVTNRLWKQPYHRLAREGGLWMLIGGYLLLLGYGLVQFLISDEPALPRIAVAAIVLGSVMLLVTFIRERIHTHAVDPYKDVQR